MKRESIIRGLTKWAAREIKPRLPAFSPSRIAVGTLEFLAVTSPGAAEAVASTCFGPVVSTLLTAAGTDFDQVADALVKAVQTEGKMLLTLPTASGATPYSLSETDFKNIISEIRTAEASA